MTEDEVRQLIVEIASVPDIAALIPDQPLTEQGLDSLDLASLLLLVEERYGVVVPDSSVSECSTINGLLKFANNVKGTN